MVYTQADILERISKLIDYNEVVRLLELDLNTIAREVVTEAEDYIEFKVFFDSGEFDFAVEAQAPGEGPGFHKTPVLLSLVSGDYENEKGPQIFQTNFRIEILGFEKDKENLRKILEIYSSLNQGGIKKNTENEVLTTSVTDFPVFSEIMQYRGFERVSIYMRWILTFIYSGQLSNEVEVSIDDDNIDLLSFNIKRLRVGDSIHKNNGDETLTWNKSQVLAFNAAIVYDGSAAAKKVLKNIKKNGANLNDELVLKVRYPNITEMTDDEEVIVEEDTYNVTITEGDITINAGGYMTLTFAMTLM